MPDIMLRRRRASCACFRQRVLVCSIRCVFLLPLPPALEEDVFFGPEL